MPLRRVSRVVALAVSITAVIQISALATCPEPIGFDRAVRQADAVWWATVTDAGVTGAAAPGRLGLTVHVLEALKGSMPETPKGSFGTVFVPSCGPMLKQDQLTRDAEALIGTTQLFIGTFSNGVFVRSFGPIGSAGMSEGEQLMRAKQVLHLERPVGIEKAAASSAWIPWLAGAVILVVLGGFLLLRRRTATRPPPGSS